MKYFEDIAVGIAWLYCKLFSRWIFRGGCYLPACSSSNESYHSGVWPPRVFPVTLTYDRNWSSSIAFGGILFWLPRELYASWTYASPGLLCLISAICMFRGGQYSRIGRYPCIVGWATYQQEVSDIGCWLSSYWDLDNQREAVGCHLAYAQIELVHQQGIWRVGWNCWPN